eukprot:TRINITY_DN10166_c0_g1_i1.p1 TRINITY_DN10166_c0_g1~~TRINITY_DN10166_c0_g1_i1.p1  ORF type:complete len:1091 (+),score=287.71 TRINITY_DN10166_c0_g1_i1:127-3399(+)
MASGSGGGLHGLPQYQPPQFAMQAFPGDPSGMMGGSGGMAMPRGGAAATSPQGWGTLPGYTAGASCGDLPPMFAGGACGCGGGDSPGVMQDGPGGGCCQGPYGSFSDSTPSASVLPVTSLSGGLCGAGQPLHQQLQPPPLAQSHSELRQVGLALHQQVNQPVGQQPQQLPLQMSHNPGGGCGREPPGGRDLDSQFFDQGGCDGSAGLRGYGGYGQQPGDLDLQRGGGLMLVSSGGQDLPSAGGPLGIGGGGLGRMSPMTSMMSSLGWQGRDNQSPQMGPDPGQAQSQQMRRQWPGVQDPSPHSFQQQQQQQALAGNLGPTYGPGPGAMGGPGFQHGLDDRLQDLQGPDQRLAAGGGMGGCDLSCGGCFPGGGFQNDRGLDFGGGCGPGLDDDDFLSSGMGCGGRGGDLRRGPGGQPGGCYMHEDFDGGLGKLPGQPGGFQGGPRGGAIGGGGGLGLGRQIGGRGGCGMGVMGGDDFVDLSLDLAGGCGQLGNARQMNMTGPCGQPKGGGRQDKGGCGGGPFGGFRDGGAGGGGGCGFDDEWGLGGGMDRGCGGGLQSFNKGGGGGGKGAKAGGAPGGCQGGCGRGGGIAKGGPTGPGGGGGRGRGGGCMGGQAGFGGKGGAQDMSGGGKGFAGLGRGGGYGDGQDGGKFGGKSKGMQDGGKSGGKSKGAGRGKGDKAGGKGDKGDKGGFSGCGGMSGGQRPGFDNMRPMGGGMDYGMSMDNGMGAARGMPNRMPDMSAMPGGRDNFGGCDSGMGSKGKGGKGGKGMEPKGGKGKGGKEKGGDRHGKGGMSAAFEPGRAVGAFQGGGGKGGSKDDNSNASHRIVMARGPEEKLSKLVELMGSLPVEKEPTIVWCNKRELSSQVAEALQQQVKGCITAEVHNGQTPDDMQVALNQFRSRQVNVLVMGMAARGPLDVRSRVIVNCSLTSSQLEYQQRLVQLQDVQGNEQCQVYWILCPTDGPAAKSLVQAMRRFGMTRIPRELQDLVAARPTGPSPPLPMKPGLTNAPAVPAKKEPGKVPPPPPAPVVEGSPGSAEDTDATAPEPEKSASGGKGSGKGWKAGTEYWNQFLEVCWDFQQGTCRRGDACRWGHPA